MSQSVVTGPCSHAALTIRAIPELYAECCRAMADHLISEDMPALTRWWENHQEEREILADMSQPTPWISNSGFVIAMCGALVCANSTRGRESARALNHAIALARIERELRRFNR